MSDLENKIFEHLSKTAEMQKSEINGICEWFYKMSRKQKRIVWCLSDLNEKIAELLSDDPPSKTSSITLDITASSSQTVSESEQVDASADCIQILVANEGSATEMDRLHSVPSAVCSSDVFEVEDFVIVDAGSATMTDFDGDNSHMGNQ